MKAYALLAALTLVVPTESFAGNRHGSYCGPSYSSYRSYCPTYSYSRSYCYSRPSYYSYGYRPYYAPSYYGYGYGYRPYYYSGYAPAVSIAYTSTPRTYYRSAPAYDNDSGSLEVDVQRALKRRGYYSGGIDGDIGPASRAGIRAYQNEHGLDPSGRIDSALLRSLGL